ncbi:hypothetical protein TREMEDRAFT_65768 [Tremella mesenterica DSM 1558]|uniref:uncharacterized protein n=1 Tax=Tremella mesenterica (strain ATCC 24925 / CBS 8224 / DSM 1558 / NBRC 9311 / NRRL Y-6157 / RJB 2259-6 / UBC 559-6) TaxID=578456 RepID=UPI00032CE4A0|nr:uncharacterized protein TREMEDRAFT_65768 [Tremella mesenterica DSM 1558]EIW66166.1 hypothetical protein TREMEDRAFT_65768 [Tremella mesenterica DSM 1558]
MLQLSTSSMLAISAHLAVSLLTRPTPIGFDPFPPPTAASPCSTSKEKGYNLAPSITDDTPRNASRVLNAWKVQSRFREMGKTSSEDTGERRKRKRTVRFDFTQDDKEKSVEEKAKDDLGRLSEVGDGEKGKRVKLSEGDRGDGGGGGGEGGKGKVQIPKIGHHETLGEYNRRIESLLRPGVTQAMKIAQRKGEGEAETERGRGRQREREEAPSNQLKLISRSLTNISTKPSKSLNSKNTSSKSDEEISNHPSLSSDPIPVKEFPMAARRRFNDIVQAPPSLPRLRQSSSMNYHDSDTGSNMGQKSRLLSSETGSNMGQKSRRLHSDTGSNIRQKRESDSGISSKVLKSTTWPGTGKEIHKV